MKVLMAHCFYRSSAPSGEDSVYRNEKKLLEDYGIEVITYEKNNDDLDNAGLIGRIGAGAKFIWSSLAYKEISELLTTHKPDIVHFHNIFPQLSTSVYAACRKHNIPVVQTLHNFRYICPSGLLQRNNRPCEDCIEKSLASSLVNKCYRGSFVATLPMAGMILFNRVRGNFKHNVNAYIALTHFAKSKFILGGIPEDKITVKPNFVTKAEINTQQTPSADSKYVVYVGRLTQEKGITTLVEACKSLKDIPLKIVGDGELRATLESTAIQFNLNIEFLGQQPKDIVLSTIKNSQFLIIPSECYEGFPVTIAEAYSCGKPVLGTDIGSLKEIIEQDITGRKFSFGSSHSLTSEIRKLWEDTESLAIMSENALASYNQRYNAESNLKQLLSIYNNTLTNSQN